MARLPAALLLLWTLLLGPALCGGGVLEHPCECGSELQCQHEEACADDPCPSLGRVDGGASARPGLDLPAAWLPATPLLDGRLAAHRSRAARPPLPPDRSNLPYAPSDRPLRS